MTIERDPHSMSEAERLQEVARILARAYLRRRQKALALNGESTALLCPADGSAAPQEGDK